ncbi:MAG: hypothetical protein NTV19_13855 [Burkholderiales bacterium]|nr:hypothetical protein [Burkholderiales bacterium]
MDGERGEEFRVDGRRLRRLLDAAQLAPFTRLDDRRGVLAPALTFLAIALLVWAGWSAWQAGAWALVAACALLMGHINRSQKNDRIFRYKGIPFLCQ